MEPRDVVEAERFVHPDTTRKLRLDYVRHKKKAKFCLMNTSYATTDTSTKPRLDDAKYERDVVCVMNTSYATTDTTTKPRLDDIRHEGAKVL